KWNQIVIIEDDFYIIYLPSTDNVFFRFYIDMVFSVSIFSGAASVIKVIFYNFIVYLYSLVAGNYSVLSPDSVLLDSGISGKGIYCIDISEPIRDSGPLPSYDISVIVNKLDFSMFAGQDERLFNIRIVERVEVSVHKGHLEVNFLAAVRIYGFW